MKKLFVSLMMAAALSSCSKEDSVCYKCNDNLGNEIGTYCGEDQAEVYGKVVGAGIGINNQTQFDSQCQPK